MNLMIGSSAGTFSTILRFLSWMLVEDISNNNVSLGFHWPNKTDFEANSFFKYDGTYRNWYFNQVPQHLLERHNYINDIFTIEQKKLDFDFYVEDHVYTFRDSIKVYPDILTKHDGAGFDISQYFKEESLSQLRKLYSEQWKKLGLSDYIQNKINKELEIIKGKKVLTVMIRYSGHYLDHELSIDEILNEVESKIEDYDNILVITQINNFLNSFVQRFGTLCIFPERLRFNEHRDWKGNDGMKILSNEEYLREIEDCIIDVVLASETNHIISGASNMFLGALCINPNISFSIFNSLKDINGA
jgi:hypothetical protein